MAEEAFGWLFVGTTPLLYEKKKVARQFQIENWLDLAQVARELGINNLIPTGQSVKQPSYIV